MISAGQPGQGTTKRLAAEKVCSRGRAEASARARRGPDLGP